MQAVDPRRRGGHAPAAADVPAAQAGHHARRPAVPGVHARVAAGPRRRRRDPQLRLPSRPRCARRSATARRWPAAALRRGARAARHGGRPASTPTTSSGLDDRFLMLNGDVLTDVDVGAQLAAARAHGRGRDARRWSRRRPVGLRARPLRRREAGHGLPGEARAEPVRRHRPLLHLRRHLCAGARGPRHDPVGPQRLHRA